MPPGGVDAGGDDAGPTGDAGADAVPPPACAEHVMEDVRIPMRDGAELAAFVRRPVAEGCALPVVLVQTPYDKENARRLWFEADPPGPLFASTDYAFVVVDWRGFYASTDAGMAMPGQRGQDGFDIVEWIAAQPWSDGRVGTWGVSALCRVQWQTAVEQPPALVAMVPIFCAMNDSYAQYYPGGVIRLEYIETIGVLFGASSPFFDHPHEDATWRFLASRFDPARVRAPALVVGGSYDLHPTVGFRDFDAVLATSAPEVRGEHRLLIGPWSHYATSGESRGIGREFTEEEQLWLDHDGLIQRSSLLFFDRHLRQLAGPADGWPTVRVLAERGGAIEEHAAWPPPEATERTFYLAAGGALADAPPPSAAEIDFPYDPADPSPTIGGATLRFDLLHGPMDQGEALARADAVPFVTGPLSAPLRLRGAVRLEVELETTGADTDLAVRLTDVDPDGRHLQIGEGIARLKLRESTASPSPVVPGGRYSLTVELTAEIARDIAAGHRLGLILTGSNYPRFDRNPGTGDDFYDEAAAPRAVVNTVALDGTARLFVDVLP